MRDADWPRVVDLLVTRCGFLHLLERAPPDLLAMVRQIPPGASDVVPHLHLVSAAGRLAAGDPVDARRHLEAVPWAANVRSDARRTVTELVCLTLLAGAAEARADVADLLPVSEQAFALLAEATLADEQRLPLRAATLQHLATAYMWSGELTRAAWAASQATHASAEARLPGLLVRSVGMSAKVAVLRGQPAVVDRCMEFLQLPGQRLAHWDTRPQSHALHVSSAWVALQRLEFSRAAEALRRARALVRSSGETPWRYTTNLAEIHLAVAMGEAGRAAELMDLSPTLPAGTLVDQLQAACEAKVLVALGEPVAALQRVDRGAPSEPTNDLLLARAQVLLALDRRAEAAAATESMRVPSMDSQPVRSVEAWLVAAAAHSGRSAANALRKALSLAVEDRIRLPFRDLAPFLAGVLRENEDLAGEVADLMIGQQPPRGRGQGSSAAAALPRGPRRLPLVTGLTERERDVLARLPSLDTTDEIALALYVTSNTVKTHLKSLYRKFGVSTRREAVRAADELGLLARPHLAPAELRDRPVTDGN